MNNRIGFVEGKGRAVFALRVYKTNELIESCPVILLEQKEANHAGKTKLADYLYMWTKGKQQALALGHGSLYNHSNQNNAYYLMDPQTQTIDIYARKPIEIGTEITVHYGAEDPSHPIWFDLK